MSTRTAATLVAAACLVLGAAGGSVAAAQITGDLIQDGTVTAKDLKNRTLKPGDFAGNVRGDRGGPGPSGTVGPRGSDTGAGYSWVFNPSVAPVPAMSTSHEVTVTCPAGTTVLGGSGFWEKPLDVLDSSKVPGQERWRLLLGNSSGNTPVPVTVYAWCAGLTSPAIGTS
ncbi:hypothetical protein [Nocardioides sp.]|uniref:hypothetical protein n=1 Tax=Nocardioides sp. TaxID=35761 RepID=UPI001A2DC700|nr:hypothetical protein [Nocardioides sp.]MBJ7355784.1 hypothetical protein [Nocardioides sp.]